MSRGSSVCSNHCARNFDRSRNVRHFLINDSPRMKGLVISIVVVLVVMATTCQGKPIDPHHVALEIFHGNDINHDGEITRLEMEKIFDQFDTDGSGTESRHEYTESVCSRYPDLYNLAHYLYDEMDIDQDNELEKHDYDQFYAKINSGNPGGFISEQEFVNFFVTKFHQHFHKPTHPQNVHGTSACTS